MSRKNPWFRPKRTGWGWSPNTWQGWLITALAVAIIIAAVVLTRGALHH
ncbi:hypothetical protein [Microbacterium capsulatum]|uniref:Uncharacterized protein n=1 Tax=Microbacterium capsulatum TaxID=3041921 RepID=A0ABU0XCR3_9MICO|nr:hypothetical protein [Microbacterium sp. ASV81]MDQ4212904.1 hypothetical protein [Microbacterium sp. ASV81]